MIYRMEGNRLILTLEKPMTLAELFTYFSVSKKQRHLCRMNGSIHCAGKIIRNDDHLLQGEVTIDLSQEQIDWVISDTPSQLVYSSPFLLVVHKPAGCIIHGDADDHTCLNARVAKTCVDQGISCSIRPIHRLDQDTCGLVVYSLHSFYQPWLEEQLAEKIERTPAFVGHVEAPNISKAISLDTLFDIATGLDIPVYKFLMFEDA